ncbi:MAG: EAL domain-containing protein [Candidatus Dormibacteria bacterium]
MTSPRIKILIADDEEVMRRALADFLGSDGRFEVLPTAVDASSAVELAAEHRPDVALLDVRMPGGGGPAAARAIGLRSPATSIVALSAHDDRETVLEMMENGARGYVIKGGNPNDIIEAALKAAAGWVTISPEVASGVVGTLAAQLQLVHEDGIARDAKVNRVQRAVMGVGLSIAYQPIWDLRAQTIAGYEALSRFASEPVRSPDLWFAEAGEFGLGSDLELTAARLALSTNPAGLGGEFLTVNLSPETLLSGDFDSILAGADLRTIVLEITEHAAVADYAALMEAINILKQSGVRTAVDDAGSGYASFRHILNLDPQMIKLDVSLTSGIDHDPKRRALASALIAFADSTGADVVAEGIEHRSELDTLIDLGASHGQGYLLGRPQSVDQIMSRTLAWPSAA